MTTLEERLRDGASWSSQQWAEARLVDRFTRRVPADVNLAVAQAVGEAERYVAGYNIWMHHVLDSDGSRPFPPKMRLLSHWNLRDEIKSQYANGAEGVARAEAGPGGDGAHRDADDSRGGCGQPPRGLEPADAGGHARRGGRLGPPAGGSARSKRGGRARTRAMR